MNAKITIYKTITSIKRKKAFCIYGKDLDLLSITID